MINETTYTKEWILKKSSQYVRGKKKADPTLIEKVTKALYLWLNHKFCGMAGS